MTKATLELLCLLLLSLQALGELNIGSFDKAIDPGRLTWWQSNWSPASVEFSKINANAEDVSITLRWSSSVDLESGLLELILPAGLNDNDGNTILSIGV